METRNRNRRRTPPPLDPESIFKGNSLGFIILLMLLCYNSILIGNCFRFVFPSGVLNVGMIDEAMIYGVAIALLISKILFHEKWDKAKGWNAGLIALLINTVVIATYFNPFGLPSYFHKLMMQVMIIALPIVGLLVITISLQKSESEPEAKRDLYS